VKASPVRRSSVRTQERRHVGGDAGWMQLVLSLDPYIRSAAAAPPPVEPSRIEQGRYKLPVVKEDCDQAGVCLKFSCRLNTALDVTPEAIRFQHEGGIGETRMWPATGDDAFVERLTTWLESVTTTCALDLIRDCDGMMEMEDVGDALGISKELAYRDLRRATAKIQASHHAEALRELLVARIECADGREASQPDSDE
jgi:hypothetical protein